MLDWIRKGLRRLQPRIGNYQQFVRDLIAEFQRQGCKPNSYDPQQRAFVFDDGNGPAKIWPLGDTFGSWLPQDQNGRAELISWFVRGIVEAGKNATLNPEQLPGQLMPGIRSRAQISSTLIQNWIAGAPIDNSSETAWVAFVGDLAVCVLRDQRETMAQMMRSNLSFANLPMEQAMPRAMANFRTRTAPPIFEPAGDGVFGCSSLADHQSALLLLEPGKDYVLPPVDGTPVAIVPSRHLFYLTGSANMPGLVRLLDISQRAREMPFFCSATMLQWNGDYWSEFHFEPGSAQARRQRQIALDQLAADYGLQKQLLDQYHQQQGKDIFVASLMCFQKKDPDSVTSVATLASGTAGTLLPQADRMLLAKQIVDPRTGLAQEKPEDSANVGWSEAMDIVGHLFEPVPYLYPPRLRALGFPDAAAWTKLKALAQWP